jgi:hypothetical protein
MNFCFDIAHPLSHLSGISRSRRTAEAPDPESIRIDDRQLADFLKFASDFALQVNFFDQTLQLSDWQPFFSGSIPFTVAGIAKSDPAILELDYQKLSAQLAGDNNPENIQWLVDFLYSEAIDPWNRWYNELEPAGNSLFLFLDKTISGELSLVLREYIALVNGAGKHFTLKKPDFQHFLENPAWLLEIPHLFAVNDSFIHAPGGIAGRLRALQKDFDTVFQGFYGNQKLLVEQASVEALLDEEQLLDIEAFRKNHAPHLGLFYTFLKLYKNFQEGTNDLTKKHLDYLYRHVLCFREGNPVADQAHLILELQKFQQKYLLTSGTQVRDGKDKNQVDILFALNDDIVVNKAQVVMRKTLLLNFLDLYESAPAPGKITTDLIEGIYIAPEANSLDGLGEPFEEEGSDSWFTTGSKKSKQLLPGKTEATDHPYGRIGFILASPVLLLNEGKREVVITLTCEVAPPARIDELDLGKFQTTLSEEYFFITTQTRENAKKTGLSAAAFEWLNGLLSARDKLNIGTDTSLIDSETSLTTADKTAIKLEIEKKRAFNVFFSGEKEWIIPADSIVEITKSGANYILKFTLMISQDQPAVTFFNRDTLKENIQTTLPLVRIEIDQDIKINCPGDLYDPACCLERCIPASTVPLSVYEYLKGLKVTESKIDVSVCGIRNMILQNDENVMDVNGTIYPFGTRPDIADSDIVSPPTTPPVNPNLIGPNFYIGSKEVFCKNWQKTWININWKDKPADFFEHYKAYVLRSIGGVDVYGLDEKDFEINLAIREKQNWHREKLNSKIIDRSDPPDGVKDPHPVTGHNNRVLFDSSGSATPCLNFHQDDEGDFLYEQTLEIDSNNFDLELGFANIDENLDMYRVDTPGGFLRMTLENQDFLHKDYAYVLARQMMALGKLPREALEGAVYIDHDTNNVFTFSNVVKDFKDLESKIDETADNTETTRTDTQETVDEVNDPTHTDATVLDEAEEARDSAIVADDSADSLKSLYSNLKNVFSFFDIVAGIVQLKALEVPIPNEPYTPVIKDITLDYTAVAQEEHISLIHLHAFENTHDVKDIEQEPTLLPVYTDEGSLFLGIENISPGSNLTILFQLAETTANSEGDPAEIEWAYLRNNQWIALRTGFEILDDDTDNLTRSGIIKLSIPRDIALKGHTIMPDNLAWLKVSAKNNTGSIAETVDVYTQAVKATFSIGPKNDLDRLNQSLAAGNLSKLAIADANVKKVSQPYGSFGGRLPSADFYLRVSEHLHHKGKGIASFGYERLVLENFPEVFLAKCIQHTYGLSANKYRLDLELAPGYVQMAVIADVSRLEYNDRFAPELPVSKLNKIEKFLKSRISAFVGIKANNPRYERINIGVRLVLLPGKDENYFTDKLAMELRVFLSPWVEGDLSQLGFGRSISLSAVLLYIESRDYVDYVLELQIIHEEDKNSRCYTKPIELCPCDDDQAAVRITPQELIEPLTARSILVAGKIDISVCLPDCDPEQQGSCDRTVRFHVCESTDTNGNII